MWSDTIQSKNIHGKLKMAKVDNSIKDYSHLYKVLHN